MPTGYTAKLMEEGMEFKPFILQCARAFGALIMMRDDPMDATIPDKFEPSDYHTKALARAQEKNRLLSAMTNDEKITYGQEEKDKAVKQTREWLERDTMQNARLSEMQSLVRSWRPPTPDHEGLKKFMLEQIDISMNNLKYMQRRVEETEGQSPVEFYIAAASRTARNVVYHEKENDEEIKRAATWTEWVRQLRKSIGEEVL